MQVITNPTPNRKLESWLRSYTEFTSNTEAPAEFHMWTAVSTIAGAMNRKCWIDMGMFQIYPSMYIIFVAPPGIATKSTTAGIGSELLEETETISLAASSGSWQGMLDELQESAKVVQLFPGKPNVTISPLHIFASELGTFLKLHDGDQIDILVDLWDGKSKLKRRLRSSGETVIPRPYLNLIGCTTPAWLCSNAEDYFIGGGFFSRTIFVYSERKEKLIAYPEDNLNYSLRDDLLSDLKEIAKMKGEFTLSPEAKEWGIEWYEDTYLRTPEHLKGEKYQGYISRRQNHLHKVAMVVSASERPDRIITLEHLQIANQMLFLAENNLKTIYESIVTNDKVAAYKKVKTLMSRLKRSSKQQLYMELASQFGYDDFEAALKAASFTGEI